MNNKRDDTNTACREISSAELYLYTEPRLCLYGYACEQMVANLLMDMQLFDGIMAARPLFNNKIEVNAKQPTRLAAVFNQKTSPRRR